MNARFGNLSCAIWLGTLCLILSAGRVSAADTLSLLPAQFTLTSSAAQQRLVLERMRDQQFAGQVDTEVVFTSSNPAVVKIDGQVTVPTGNGEATITATRAGQTAVAKVKVEAFDQPLVWSFRNQVEPVLAKAGCNTGACHGALAGKKGFRLSLAGFDPVADFSYITRQARSRRIVLSDPGRSLVLTKPTGAIPHKGGVRFAVDSPEYQILSQWIASGAPAPQDSDARLTKLEIFPATSLQAPGARQQLLVTAHFSDGRTEDVTRWARYTSGNESVASVDPQGLASVTGHGEAAIKAWYMSWNVVATISSAYPTAFPADTFTKADRRNFIDELVLAKLASLNLPPSPPASDGEFLRRAFVDTIGVLPTVEETRAFLADGSPDKRDKLIESLLARPEFVDYWAYKWSDLLLVNSEKLRAPAMWAYYHWIRNQVATNTPWDQLARAVITATGSTLENGATNFYVLHQDPPDLAETTSVAFLGMAINCAKCHNHPLEKWTNDQYYSMANLFARVRTKDIPGEGNRLVYSAPSGELTQPRTGKPQPPTPLDGVQLPFDSSVDRREHLANWLTAPENPYFARAITNRVWANFFGVGLVEAVDDLRLTNPASNEALLSAAAGYLREHSYDLKSLMRAILQSATYARSSQPLPENAADGRFYSRYYPRRMMAEVLLDAISQVSGTPTAFADYAPGWRALQLPDANVNSYFLKSFGRSARIITCECERTAQPSMVQVLHLSNGDTINQKLADAGSRLSKLVAEKTPPEKIVEEAYLAALCRLPTESEKSRLVAALAEATGEEQRLVLEDLYWSILSSKEFLFNH